MPIPYTLLKIKDSISQGASSAVKKSENLIELSKLSLESSSYEKKLDELYINLGKKIYKDLKDNKYVSKELKNYISDIKEMKKEIKILEKEILKLKKKKLCPVCAHEIDKHCTFCGRCGSKIE